MFKSQINRNLFAIVTVATLWSMPVILQAAVLHPMVVVGIPANNFGGQEPGSNQEIKTFCSAKYNVTFPMMAKVSVKGGDKAPLYQFLTDKSANPQVGGEIEWNFTKFVVGPDGHPVARFEPDVTPDSPQVVASIERELMALKK